MFVGHGLVAFALVALLGHHRGWTRKRTLQLAVLAAAFATLPDIDVVYAPVSLLLSAGPLGVDTFWSSANEVHRTVTHSVVVALVAAAGFGLWAVPGKDSQRRLLAPVAGLAVLAGLVAMGTVTAGLIGGAVLVVFAGFGLAITTVAMRHGVSARELGGVALVGIASHPFGDLFTGDPPTLLYPLDVSLLSGRVVVHPDPTLHLLSAFALELCVIWLAVYAAGRLYDVRLGTHLRPRAALGTGYAVAALVIPAPTLAVSYHFVLSVLAVGVVGSVEFPTFLRGYVGEAASTDGGSSTSRRWPGRADAPTTVVTGLSAVTLAVAAYTTAYVLLF